MLMMVLTKIAVQESFSLYLYRSEGVCLCVCIYIYILICEDHFEAMANTLVLPVQTVDIQAETPSSVLQSLFTRKLQDLFPHLQILEIPMQNLLIEIKRLAVMGEVRVYGHYVCPH